MQQHQYTDPNFTLNDTLQKADLNDHKKFKSAIAVVFELDVKIIVYMNDKGLIEYPIVSDEENSYNYIQLISNTCIDKILSYLFCDKSSHQYSNDENELRTLHIRKIMNKYENAITYFEKVSERLWKKSSWLHDNYDYCCTMASRKMTFELEEKANRLAILHKQNQLGPAEPAEPRDPMYEWITPTKCSSLRQNGFAMIQDHPCKIVAMTTSKD